ncbi:MAG: HNH endonuclease [Pelotomaculum sp. PtaB.Bin104]|nr:MAG: HNH endonuclease [Pelotomaculum sp. PtaB.Bin104]
MPQRPLKPCRHPGCPALTNTGYCEQHKREQWNDNRKNARQRGYTAQWEKVRAYKLKRNPLCERCEQEKRVTPAVMVHHIKPISQGGAVLDMANLMSVCRSCHDKLHSKHPGGG